MDKKGYRVFVVNLLAETGVYHRVRQQKKGASPSSRTFPYPIIDNMIHFHA